MQHIHYSQADMLHFITRQKNEKLACKVMDCSYAWALTRNFYIQRYFVKHFLRWFCKSRGYTLDVAYCKTPYYVYVCYGKTITGERVLIAPSTDEVVDGGPNRIAQFCDRLENRINKSLGTRLQENGRRRDLFLTYGEIKPFIHSQLREQFHEPVAIEILD